jgi:hypothetical protein
MKILTLKPKLWKFYWNKTKPNLELINWGFLTLENNSFNTTPTIEFEILKV